MTRCSDTENDDQCDDGAGKPSQKRSKGGKRVSFPPDEQIVSGFAEHGSSDRTADSCLTLMEVTVAYQQSCSKHQVQPRERILHQLQQGARVGGGEKRLDLRGERLDHRSCEALEVVFKSLRFDFINLQAAQLEENSVCLSRLDVCNMSMVGYPAHSLSRALLTSQLRVLQLHNVQLSGLPLYTLVGGLKTNKVLQELHLTNNLLNSHQDALHLGDLLSSNSCLQLLELSNNAVADDGLEELCDGLRRQTAGLNVLLLRNNQITAKGMVHLAKALPSLTVLQVLDLGENHVGNKGVQVIREPLMMNGSLLQLGLAHASITCEGAVALAEFLAESHQIQRLDIRQNHVRTGGLMALCLALRINRSLASLDLDHEAPQEQEEFLKDTQIRLRSEISKHCLDNANRSSLTMETPPAPVTSPPPPAIPVALSGPEDSLSPA